MKIAVAGHTCLDIIPGWSNGGIDLLIPGHTIDVDKVKLSAGGVVPNTGLALKKLGIPVSLFGKLGNDSFGEIIYDILNEKDSNLTNQLIISSDEKTSYTIVLSPPDTDRIFLHYSGTNDTFNSNDVNYNYLKECDIFHFGYPPLMKNMYLNNGKDLISIFKKAKSYDLITSLDLAMPDQKLQVESINWNKILSETMNNVDIFMPSFDEFLYIMDKRLYDKVFIYNEKNVTINMINTFAEKALNWGAKIVLIKLGEKGIYLKSRSLKSNENQLLSNYININTWSDVHLYSPNFNVNVVGTNGAGDSAVAGFLASIINNNSPENALTLAAATGACSVEGKDASGGIKNMQIIQNRISSGWKRNKPGIQLTNWKEGNSGVWYAP